jgi:hypothetical protein
VGQRSLSDSLNPTEIGEEKSDIGVIMSQPDSNSQQQYQNVTVLSNVALPNNHFGDFG